LDSPDQQALFHRTFELAGTPAAAVLRVRAFGNCSVALNGRPIQLSPRERWNQEQTADLVTQLRIGANGIRATVTNANDVGPPALWLVLEGSGWSVRSDQEWRVSLDGAVECPAHLAHEPLSLRSGNPAFGGVRTFESLRRCLPELAIFGLVSAAFLFGLHRAERRPIAFQLAGYHLEPIQVGLFLAILLWILLLSHNLLSVPLFLQGFDAPGHLSYIQYIQERRALPLADEGWEMHQPPLYYALMAGLFGLFCCSTADPGALLILRLMALAVGLGQLAALAGCLRLIFPDQPRPQLVGLALAACLPAPIYLSHYITNETLLMLLGTLAIYFCLRILNRPSPSLTQFALLGLCLGAALLTKLTALVPAGVILIVLTGKAMVAHKPVVPRSGRWLLGVTVTALVAIVVSGWHYVRVWRHFGTPLVGNFDSISGYHFWQDPGYGTFSYLIRFGRALTDPFFSALNGLPDGLYSTWWGDGLCGAMSGWSARPPWNYDLMGAGYLLAVVPTLFVGVGLVLAVIELLRQPRAQWFLLLGLAGGLTAALLYQFLRFPYYGHAKAFYQLTGTITACALAALGMDFLARRSRILGAAFGILFGVWASAAYLSYWIHPDHAATYIWLGRQQLTFERLADAETSFEKALNVDPGSIPARLALGDLSWINQQHTRAVRLYEEAFRADPANPAALFRQGLGYKADGKIEAAIGAWQRAAQLGPDYPLVYPWLGSALANQERFEAAIAAYRQALRVAPATPANHVNLGVLLAQTGNIEEAIHQYRWAAHVPSAQPSWLAELSWLLTTQEDSRFRDPAEGLRLAMEACSRLGQDDPACLQALAAAQAADGRYREAAQTASRALPLAETAQQLQQLRDQVSRYSKGQRFYTRAPLQLRRRPASSPAQGSVR
jgi:tetratricopeptide (TPR) repeat protein